MKDIKKYKLIEVKYYYLRKDETLSNWKRITETEIDYYLKKEDNVFDDEDEDSRKKIMRTCMKISQGHFFDHYPKNCYPFDDTCDNVEDTRCRLLLI